MWWHWESFFVCTLFGVALVFIYLIAETLLSCWYHRCLLRLTVTCLREYFQDGSVYRNSHGLWGEGAEILLLWWCWIVKLVTAALMRRWKIVSNSEFGCPTMPYSYDWFLHITTHRRNFPNYHRTKFHKIDVTYNCEIRKSVSWWPGILRTLTAFIQATLAQDFAMDLQYSWLEFKRNY